ncbi:MAG: hypothetical protein H6924_07920 [Alphaproteobacteria bacterium]|nr:hypothetical protein [Alphaproteobacteria bacterium]
MIGYFDFHNIAAKVSQSGLQVLWWLCRAAHHRDWATECRSVWLETVILIYVYQQGTLIRENARTTEALA